MLESLAITWMPLGCSVPLLWYTRGVSCTVIRLLPIYTFDRGTSNWLDRPSTNALPQLKNKKIQRSPSIACYSWLIFSMACPTTEKQRDGR
ncbi:hypothetical protein C8J57DRAFT_1407341 [Mycena rebaudengoi]|nr:hypothetical protein C8J57DRAFT_1407341 [Mycena rebaudengoi]